MGYIYIFLTIFFTVYGQLIIKWRMPMKGALPEGLLDKLWFILHAYTDLWIMSGFFSAFLASMAWSAAMTKFELSHAYPFMSLSFVLVFILSIFIFGEVFTWAKLLGLFFIVLGVVISVQKF
jgi:multidrug transporter EmrE-like cation transporter